MSRTKQQPKQPPKPDLVHLGLTWQDMPGQGEDNKRMNFSLFRMGKITLDYVRATVKQRALMNGSGAVKRGGNGRFVERAVRPFGVLVLAGLSLGLLPSCAVIENATIDDCVFGVAELVTGPFVLARDGVKYGVRPRKSAENPKED